MKRKIMFGMAVLVIVAFGVLLGFTARASEKEKAEPIKIGMTANLTGAQGMHGQPVINGIKAYIHKVSKEGGVLGRSVELIVVDDKTSPADAVKNVRDFIHTHKVDFIIQAISSSCSLAVSEICRTAKVPAFCLGLTEAITMEKGHRYVFRPILSSTVQYYGAAQYIKKHWPDRKKFYIMAHDFEFGRRLSSDFWKYMQKMNPNAVLVGESYIKMTETDYSPYIAKLKGSKPEILFNAWGSATNFVKQAKHAGVYDEIQVVAPSWALNELVSWGKTDTPTGLILGGIPWYAIHSPENTAFVNLMKELYNVAPTEADYFGYLTAMFGLEAIKKARSTDKEKVVNALEGMTLSTPIGKVTIREFDHQSNSSHFLGRVAWSDKYGYGILENVERISADECLPGKAEVEAARKKGQ